MEMNTREAAQSLNVSVQTLRNWIKSGRIVPTVHGTTTNGGSFFSAESIEAARSNMPRRGGRCPHCAGVL